jgi:ABC-2 type transport system permease protein
MTQGIWFLLKRELLNLLRSPMAYVIFVCFSLVTIFAFQFCVAIMDQGVRNFTIMQIFFQIFFFWFVLIIMIPLITMRMFSDEYKSGTIELLMTAPITEWDVVLSKFIAAVLFYVALWVPTLFYGLAYQVISGAQVPLGVGPVMLSYLIVFLIGSFFISIGCFTSAFTSNQAIAGFASFAIIALFFFTGFLGFMTTNPAFEEFFRYISMMQQMRGFTEGSFDSRPVVLYVTGTALFLVLTQRVLMNRKLKA